jgi:hypothetical protein
MLAHEARILIYTDYATLIKTCDSLLFLKQAIVAEIGMFQPAYWW